LGFGGEGRAPLCVDVASAEIDGAHLRGFMVKAPLRLLCGHVDCMGACRAKGEWSLFSLSLSIPRENVAGCISPWQGGPAFFERARGLEDVPAGSMPETGSPWSPPRPCHTPPLQSSVPPWRQPKDKWMVSLVNSHTNATSNRWHLWEIDLRFALKSTPGWYGTRITRDGA